MWVSGGVNVWLCVVGGMCVCVCVCNWYVEVMFVCIANAMVWETLGWVFVDVSD